MCLVNLTLMSPIYMLEECLDSNPKAGGASRHATNHPYTPGEIQPFGSLESLSV